MVDGDCNTTIEAPKVEEFGIKATIAALAVPALQAAATLTLLNFQNNIAEDRIDDAQKILAAARDKYCACLDEYLELLEMATDDVPKAAYYNPVSVGGEVFEALKDASRLAKYAKEYAECWGKNARDVDIARMKATNPLYSETQEKIWTQLSSLICGETAIDVAIEITGDAAQTNALTGRLGTCQLTTRKLGINSLSNQQLGRVEKRAEEAHFNQHVSPFERNPSLQQFIVDPTQRVSFGIQQGQLMQQSMQNAYNLCAQKDPYLLQQWQMKMECCRTELQVAMSQASSALGFVPNYLGTFGPQLNAFFETNGSGIASGIGSGLNALGGLFQNSGVTPTQTPTVAPTVSVAK